MSVASIPNAIDKVTSTNQRKGESICARFLANNILDFKSGDLWRAAFAEYVGVCFLVFFAVAVGLRSEEQEPVPLLQVAICVGFLAGAVISSLTTVSGGHINPAISMGFLVSNQITLIRFFIYTIVQTGGAISAVGLIQAVMPSSHHGNLGLILPARGVSDEKALAMEIMITGLLVFVTIAMVDKHRKDIGGSIPLMVGLTVTVNILAAGNVSGGCMNPARAMGSAVNVQNLDRQWVYWVGPLCGSAIAGWIYQNIFSTRPLPIIGRCVRTDDQTTYGKGMEEDADLTLNDVDYCH